MPDCLLYIFKDFTFFLTHPVHISHIFHISDQRIMDCLLLYIGIYRLPVSHLALCHRQISVVFPDPFSPVSNQPVDHPVQIQIPVKSTELPGISGFRFRIQQTEFFISHLISTPCRETVL